MSSLKCLLATCAVLALALPGGATAQNYRLDPNYATVNLSSGFAPDPNVTDVQSGGSINAQTRNSACLGFVSEAPDVRVNFTSGDAGLPLIISAGSSADTTLVVNGPDGSWYCDDDGGVNGQNPMIRFATPASGQYDIWVGTYGNVSLQPARLVVSELYSQ